MKVSFKIIQTNGYNRKYVVKNLKTVKFLSAFKMLSMLIGLDDATFGWTSIEAGLFLAASATKLGWVTRRDAIVRKSTSIARICHIIENGKKFINKYGTIFQ